MAPYLLSLISFLVNLYSNSAQNENNQLFVLVSWAFQTIKKIRIFVYHGHFEKISHTKMSSSPSKIRYRCTNQRCLSAKMSPLTIFHIQFERIGLKSVENERQQWQKSSGFPSMADILKKHLIQKCQVLHERFVIKDLKCNL